MRQTLAPIWWFWRRKHRAADGGQSEPALGDATVTAFDTTVTNDLSPDGFTWAAVRGAFVEDAFGKLVIYAQRYNANTRQCYFVISNDRGATWVDNAGISGGEGFLIRGDIAYDAARDCLHSLIVTANPQDGGIIYRRYSITRDEDDAITSIARVSGVSVVLDDAGADNGNGLDFPTILMPDADTLLAAWAIRTATGGEIRCAVCDLASDDDAGGDAGNWTHIGIDSTTTIGAAPAVDSYTIPFTQAATAIPYFSVLHLASGDLRLVLSNGSTNAYVTMRAVSDAPAHWDSLSTPVTLSAQRRAGTDAGYEFKEQLISQLTEDAGGTCYVGLATWKDDTDGDTWGVYAIAADDSLSASVDAFSAGGAHPYAPTGDVAYDATADRLVVTYDGGAIDGTIGLLNTDLTEAQAYAQFTAHEVDIPVIATTRLDDQVLVIWRVKGNPPQDGEYALIPWGAAAGGGDEPQADPGSILLTDTDGAYLLDTDGAYLQEPV